MNEGSGSRSDFDSDRGSEPAAGRRWLKRAVAGVALTASVLGGLASACLDRPLGAPPPVTTNVFVDKITGVAVDKIDLLLMIDNSRSMGDKQRFLRLAVPDLVERLVNPVCIDRDGNQFPAPADSQQPCPAGQSREFNPIEDINIAVVSSSLGDVGANVICPGPEVMGDFFPDRYDMAHTVGSLDRALSQGAASNELGFLEWRAGTTQLERFSDDFQNMVAVVGETGCGWEASLESWYRFLVDPLPYQSLVRVPCPGSNNTAPLCVQAATQDGPNGPQTVPDATLLAQRNAFLRPDSLVAIIMLTDENDCSIQVGGQSWLVADISVNQRMFRATSACDTNPNDKCCHSCVQDPPEGCQADPVCAANPVSGAAANRLSDVEDGQNLRCFQQKRRFGLDFLYPTERYVNALSQLDLCLSRPDLSAEDCQTDLVPNPLYVGGERSPDLVFLGGIVGVPWQAIDSPVDSNGDALDPLTELRFKTADEMTADGTWQTILGTPGTAYDPGPPEAAGQAPQLPSEPLMIEAAAARPGLSLSAPNGINGREWDTTKAGGGSTVGIPDDLQYACIFRLDPPTNCGELDVNNATCDCFEGSQDKPLCEDRPGLDPAGPIQYWAKAYPGVRQLEVLRDYGSNSIVGSICARNVTQPDQSDFGYRPAITAIVDRLKEQLGNRCLPRRLDAVGDGTVPCTLVETIPRFPAGQQCVCDIETARRDPDPDVAAQVRLQLSREAGQPCGVDDPDCAGACLCEVLQVQQVPSQDPTESLRSCQNDEDVPFEGWCYVADTDDQPQLGNPALVAECPATQRRLIRFVGQGLGPGSTTFVSCQGSTQTDTL